MAAKLEAIQTCFVVDDVERAARFCEERFGWGPFRSFTAPNEGQGTVTQVALGMAGDVQVELIRVLEGRDVVGDYQERYERGLQHLGTTCSTVEEGIETLEALGAHCATRFDVTGVRVAFMDTPVGPALIELLQILGPAPKRSPESRARVEIDRVTLVCPQIEENARFFGEAYGWDADPATTQTLELRAPGAAARERFELRRQLARTRLLEFEMIEVPEATEPVHPYARHRLEREHGLVHAGGRIASVASALGAEAEDAWRGRWLGSGEEFALVEGPAGHASLQLYAPRAQI